MSPFTSPQNLCRNAITHTHTQYPQAYSLARQDEQAKALAERIQSIFFLATPHTGSDSAKMLDRVLRISTLSSKYYVEDLQRNSRVIMRIDEEFRCHADKLDLWSFFETKMTKKAGISMLVVDKASTIMSESIGNHCVLKLLLNFSL